MKCKLFVDLDNLRLHFWWYDKNENMLWILATLEDYKTLILLTYTKLKVILFSKWFINLSITKIWTQNQEQFLNKMLWKYEWSLEKNCNPLLAPLVSSRNAIACNFNKEFFWLSKLKTNLLHCGTWLKIFSSAKFRKPRSDLKIPNHFNFSSFFGNFCNRTKSQSSTEC